MLKTSQGGKAFAAVLEELKPAMRLHADGALLHHRALPPQAPPPQQSELEQALAKHLRRELLREAPSVKAGMQAGQDPAGARTR